MIKYRVIVSEKLDDCFGLCLEEGEFQNTFISIRDLDLNKLSNEMKLEYYIIDKPKDLDEERLKSTEFESLLSDIIVDLLADITKETVVEDRGNDSEQPDT